MFGIEEDKSCERPLPSDELPSDEPFQGRKNEEPMEEDWDEDWEDWLFL